MCDDAQKVQQLWNVAQTAPPTPPPAKKSVSTKGWKTLASTVVKTDLSEQWQALMNAITVLSSGAAPAHVVVYEGEHDSVAAGVQLVLFRYLIKPLDAVTASLQLRTSCPAVSAACRMVLLDNESQEEVAPHVLNQPAGVQVRGGAGLLGARHGPQPLAPASGFLSTLRLSPLLPRLNPCCCPLNTPAAGSHGAGLHTDSSGQPACRAAGRQLGTAGDERHAFAAVAGACCGAHTGVSRELCPQLGVAGLQVGWLGRALE